VERSDAGLYWCQVKDGEETKISQSVWLTVEGEEAVLAIWAIGLGAKTYNSAEENLM
jgi:hypothetical protein